MCEWSSWTVLWIIMNPFYVWRHFRFKFIKLIMRINYHTLFWTPCIANGSAMNFLNKCYCCVLGSSFTHSVIIKRRKSVCLPSSLSFEPVNSDSQWTVSKAVEYSETRRKFCRTPVEASAGRSAIFVKVVSVALYLQWIKCLAYSIKA